MNDIVRLALAGIALLPPPAVLGQQPPNGKEAVDSDLEKLWVVLGSDDKDAVARASREMVKADSRTVAFLRQRLKPRADVKSERLRCLINAIAGDNEKARRVACKELEKIGEPAVRPLCLMLRKEPDETVLRREVDDVIDRIRRAKPSPDQLRTVRGIWVLYEIGTKAAQAIIQEVAEGALDARETNEARAALESLKERSKNRR